MHLLLVEVPERFLHRADRVEQRAVSLLAAPGDDLGVLRDNQQLFPQTVHMLRHRVLREMHGSADGSVAWVALVCLAILAAHQVTVHRQLARREAQHKDFVGQREIAF